MRDEDALPDWTLYELIEKELGIPEEVMEAIFKDEDEDGPLLARSVRAMLAFDGEGQADVVTNAWRDQKAIAEEEAGEAERKAKGLARRYKAAPSSAAGGSGASRVRRIWTESSVTRPTLSVGSTKPWTTSGTFRRCAGPRPDPRSLRGPDRGPGGPGKGP